MLVEEDLKCNTVSVQDKGHISWISFLAKEMSRLTVN